MSFHLVRPEWLLALLPIAVLVVLARRYRTNAGGGWEKWVDARLLRHLRVAVSGRSSYWPLAGMVLLWCGLVLALAGPSCSQLPEVRYRLQRPPLVVVLDLSRSMTAADPAPSRLEAAKVVLRDLLNRWPEGEVGLVVFAATAHRVLPLTEESDVVVGLLDSLGTELMPAPHSSPAAGLRLAQSMVQTGGKRGGELLLVTDGAGPLLPELAEQIRAEGTPVSVLAIGSGRTPAETNDTEEPAQTRETLLKVARAGGGVLLSYPVSPDALRDFARRDAAVSESQSAPEQDVATPWRDQGGWLIVALLPFAALVFRRGWLLTIVLVVGVSPPPVQALEWDDVWQRRDVRAMKAWERGEYHRAAELFEDPLWKGMARYRIGDYPGALEMFSQAGSAVGHFNRGVTLMRLESWTEAREAFREALRLDPGDLDAQFNQRLLEWYLSQTGELEEDAADQRRQAFEAPAKPERPEASRHAEERMASGSPDREPPGVVEIPEEDLPKGKLGGAAILLEQGSAHEGPESDTVGEARSAGAQDAQSALELGDERSAQAVSGVEDGAELEGRDDPESRVSRGPDEERRSGSEAGDGGRPQLDSYDASRREAPESSRSQELAKEASRGEGADAGVGGSQGASPQEAQQAIEQWLAGLPTDARELLRQEFRRNFERSRPNTDGVPPW